MKQEIEIALHKSRAHWWRAHSFNVNELPKKDQPEGYNCALCHKFFNSCKGCPVANATNRNACSGTPYYEAFRAFNRKDNESWKKHSKLMAEFLDDLRGETE